MLKVEDVHAYYGPSHVLQGVGLELREGEVIALLGRNGAGKTTTVRSIMGEVPPRQGRVWVKGRDVTGRVPERIARMGVALVPQGRGVFPNLTVLENLTLVHRKGEWTLDRALELFPRIKGRLKHRGNQLSGGEQQMVAFCRALLMNPDIILMDEPSEGLAPLVVQEVRRVIAQLRAVRMSILLVEQNLPLAMGVADRLYILNKGQTVHTCTPAELQADNSTKHMYLGV